MRPWVLQMPRSGVEPSDGQAPRRAGEPTLRPYPPGVVPAAPAAVSPGRVGVRTQPWPKAPAVTRCGTALRKRLAGGINASARRETIGLAAGRLMGPEPGGVTGAPDERSADPAHHRIW